MNESKKKLYYISAEFLNGDPVGSEQIDRNIFCIFQGDESLTQIDREALFFV